MPNYLTNKYLDDDDSVGRLCNKLFVIATILGTAQRYNDTEGVFPHWKYEQDFPNIPIKEIITIEEYKETYFYYENIPNIKNGNILGYFQSEKYFDNIKDKIRDFYFDPSQEIKDEVETLFKYVKDYKITSIHVRRGDYLTKPDCHPPCTMEYYNQAISMLDSETDRYLVFSDDIPWCRENFKGDKFLFSEGRRDVIDMFMMAQCNNHIMSNSSYAWWGAWLCKNVNKRVIAPKKWFGPTLPHKTMDLYCSGWDII